MVRLAATLLVTVQCLCTAAQQPPEAQLTSKDFQAKSLKQTRTANILALSGVGLIITGIVIPRGDITDLGNCFFVLCDTEYKNDNLKTAFVVAGAAVAAASIPFYLSARKNRKRAAAIAVAAERSNLAFDMPGINKSFAVVQLTVSLP